MSRNKTIFRTIKNNCFVTVDKHFIDDNKLSLQSKGLLLYLLSKPDNYYHNESDISNHCVNGRDSIRSSVNELMKAGYLIKFRSKDSSGQFTKSIWYILEVPKFKSDIPVYENNLDIDNKVDSSNLFPETPLTENPQTENPSTGKPQPENPTVIKNDPNKNDLNKNNLIKSKPDKSQKSFLRDFFLSFNIKIPDDFDWIDMRDLQDSVDWFNSNRGTVKNTNSYLSKILKEARRKTQDEIESMTFDDVQLQKKREHEKKIEEFSFTSRDEVAYYLDKFKDKAIQFTLFYHDFLNYYDHPENLPPVAFKTLKSLAIRDNSYQPVIKT